MCLAGQPIRPWELPGLKTYLTTYGAQPVVQAAAGRALFGEAPITGRLPVTIPGLAQRGSGIQKPATSKADSGMRRRGDAGRP